MHLTREVSSKQDFNEDAYEYYPSACCEILHVTNAVYLATTLQIIFVITLSILYYFMEQNSFINAVEVFRPAVVFIIFVNVIGIICALIGVILQKNKLISAQIALLAGLVIISDLIAFFLVAAMAFSGSNSRSSAEKALNFAEISRTLFVTKSNTWTNFINTNYFVNNNRFEKALGPFWIYLTAILFHLFAACTMCIIGIYRRYCKFLKDKFNYSRVHNTESCGN